MPPPSSSNVKRPHTGRTIVLSVVGTVVGLFLLIALAVWLFGLSDSSYTASSPNVGGYGMGRTSLPPSVNSVMMEAAPGMAAKSAPNSDATASGRASVGPKIIRTGTLKLRVNDTVRRLEEAKGLATQFGGFVADVSMEDDEGLRTADIVLRVPSDKYDGLVFAAKKLAVVVLSETSNAEDITDVFVDVEARMKAAKAEEAQYLDILKKARTVEETLQVTSALGEVRSRIERMDGQLRVMRDRTDFATLHLVLTEETRIEAPTRTWAPLEIIRQTFQGLIVALQGAANVLIFLVIFGIGLVLPSVLVLWVSYRLIKWVIAKMRR